MRDIQFKASLDTLTANKLKVQAARWERSISQLMAYCVRKCLFDAPLTDAEMLPPDHELNKPNMDKSLISHVVGHESHDGRN